MRNSCEIILRNKLKDGRMNTIKAIELLCKHIQEMFTDFTDYVFTIKDAEIEIYYENFNITLFFKDNGNGSFRDLRFEYSGQLLNGWRKIGGILEVDEIMLVKVFTQIYLAHYKCLETKYKEEHWEEFQDFYKEQQVNNKIDKILDK